MQGAQWTQVRLVRAGKADDSTCKLCSEALGTEQHRLVCPANVPTGGWPTLPTKFRNFREGLAENRLRHLDTRGMLALLVQAPLLDEAEAVRWLLPLPEDLPPDARWYVDGSEMNKGCILTVSLGSGLVVTAASGELIACALAIPPRWVKHASGAEAWSLYLALRSTVTSPKVTTDCQALLRIIETGKSAATASDKPMARLWNLAYGVMDSDTEVLGPDLDWMPAHTSRANHRTMFKSTGDRVTYLDWRANRLADALAKCAARASAPGGGGPCTFATAASALERAATKLGTATWAANCCQVTEMGKDGMYRLRVYRDSDAHRPWPIASAPKPAAPTPAAPLLLVNAPRHSLARHRASSTPATARTTALRGRPAGQPNRTCHAAAIGAASMKAEARFSAVWQQRLEHSLRPQVQWQSAGDRIDAVRGRLRQRAARDA
jgi:hypothetical protein